MCLCIHVSVCMDMEGWVWYGLGYGEGSAYMSHNGGLPNAHVNLLRGLGRLVILAWQSSFVSRQDGDVCLEWCQCCPFLSWVVRLEGGAFALVSTADTFSLRCSASVSISLWFLMADSTAMMRSTAGKSSKNLNLWLKHLLGWDSSPLDRFFTHFSSIFGCDVWSSFLLQVNSNAWLELMYLSVRNLRVCLSLPLKCWLNCSLCEFHGFTS